MHPPEKTNTKQNVMLRLANIFYNVILINNSKYCQPNNYYINIKQKYMHLKLLFKSEMFSKLNS